MRVRLTTARDLRRCALAAVIGGGLLTSGCGTGSTGVGLDLVSEDQVQQMGAESWQRIRDETPASDNQQYQATADEIASNLLRAAGENPAQWEVVVFASEQANAFALPGGKIGVYEGMFEVAENEDQLATVVAHEIAHVQENHSEERVNSQVATQGAVQGAAVLADVSGVPYADLVAGVLGAGAQYGVLLPYSRNQELEADHVGLQLMAEAGYDPREAVDFWQQMQQQGGESPPAFLSTHPAPGSRIDELEARMPEALETYRANS